MFIYLNSYHSTNDKITDFNSKDSAGGVVGSNMKYLFSDVNIESLEFENSYAGNEILIGASLISNINIQGNGLKKLEILNCDSNEKEFNLGEVTFKTDVVESLEIKNSRIRSLSLDGVRPVLLSLEYVLFKVIRLKGFKKDLKRILKRVRLK